MPKQYNMKNSIGFSLPAVLILVSILTLSVTGTIAVTQYEKKATVLGSKSKQNATNSSNAPKKSVTTGEETKQYLRNANKASEKLKKAATIEKITGNNTVGKELEEIAVTAQEKTKETTAAIEAVESKPTWKVLLTGPDYNNLGQLRSSMVQNRNETAKLSRTLNSVEGSVTEDAIRARLLVLEQEREKITSVITENESQFSVLGWVSKLLTGYKSGGVDDADETTPSGSTTEPSNTLTPDL